MRKTSAALFVVSFIINTTLLALPQSASRPITLTEREDYERRIDAVYWKHRIWPAENPSPKPSLEQVLPARESFRRADDVLRQQSALRYIWGKAVTNDEVQQEMERIARSTKQPQLLAELWQALDNDPQVIAECLVKPILVEQRIRRLYADESAIHSTVRMRAIDSLNGHGAPDDTLDMVYQLQEKQFPEVQHGIVYLERDQWDELLSALRQSLNLGSLIAGQASELLEDSSSYYRLRVVDINEKEVHLSVDRWKKAPFEEWWEHNQDRFETADTTGFHYSLPQIRATCTNDTWSPTIVNPPTKRECHSAVWTGTEMIIWGGWNGNYSLNTGGIYNPATDSWIPTNSVDAPDSACFHHAFWTGSEMLIWQSYPSTMGAKYNPTNDSWTSINLNGAPQDEQLDAAVWTGTEIITWGGIVLDGIGAKYNPANDQWTPLSTNGAPAPRFGHVAVWANGVMVVWGGFGCTDSSCTNQQDFNDGGRYDPLTDTWTAMSTVGAPQGRTMATAISTGNDMMVWGGQFDLNTPTNTGGKYNVTTDSWSQVSTNNAPSARIDHTAIWTGSEMIIWGGALDYTGAKYNPNTDTWTSTSLTNAPMIGRRHTAVWTGTEMIVWGGEGCTDPSSCNGIGITRVGGKYDPASDSWSSTSTDGTASERYGETAVWTGAEMIIWGGSDGYTNSDTGSRYNPALDTWFDTSLDNAPQSRYAQSAAWSGTEMIICCGYHDAFPTKTGGRYNPITDSWTPINSTDAPGATYRKAFWTGTQMIVWGSFGERYDPSTDTWLPMSTVNAPSPRADNSAVWTGKEMIIWGGWNPYLSDPYFNDGARYNPSTDSWNAISISSPPTARYNASAVWTGNEMIVWGGIEEPGISSAGGRYSVADDSWQPVSLTDAPVGTAGHVAVWTGYDMLIWGGYDGNAVLNTGKHYDPSLDQWTIPMTSIGAPEARSSADVVWTGDSAIIWGGGSNSSIVTGGIYCWQGTLFAVNDSYDAVSGVSLNLSAPGVLANDSHPQNVTLSAFLDTTAGHGTVQLQSDGSFVYAPDPGFVGADTFKYHASDGTTQSNSATVEIHVFSGHPPVAIADSYVTMEDTPLSISAPGLLQNDSDADGDQLTVVVDIPPAHGNLSLNPDGAFVYTSSSDFYGVDVFAYHVSDGINASNQASVAITITSVNDAPVSAADQYSTAIGQPFSVAAPGVLENDSDTEADSLTAILNTPPTNGLLTLSSDGSYDYSPNPGFIGVDSFTYHANDGANDGNTVTVTISVGCIYCDEFEDGTLPQWTFLKPGWAEQGGALTASAINQKTTASARPAFWGCIPCTIETAMVTQGGKGNRLSIFGWYQDKQNSVELLFKQESGKVVLKQRSAGKIVAKSKASIALSANVAYSTALGFDGINIFANIDGVQVISMLPGGPIFGTAGFSVKNTTGSFEYIRVH